MATSYQRTPPEQVFYNLQTRLVSHDARNENLYLKAAQNFESMAGRLTDMTTVYRQPCRKSASHDALVQLKKIAKLKDERDNSFGRKWSHLWHR